MRRPVLLMLALLLLAGCGGDEDEPLCEYETSTGELLHVNCDHLDELYDRVRAEFDQAEQERLAEQEALTDVEDVWRPETPTHRAEPAVDVRTGRTCTDEYDQAYNYSTLGGVFPFSVLAYWNGVPFTVDVSDSLENAHGLLAKVRAEAELLYGILGYEIFVAGDVLPLSDRTLVDYRNAVAGGVPLLPPDYHIEIRCCASSAMGHAIPSWRQVLLKKSQHMALMHELYHILALGDSDSETVPMSGSLLRGSRSTAEDWANLACIYDGGSDG